MALGALVGIVALVPALIAGDLLQRRGNLDVARRAVLIVVTGGAVLVALGVTRVVSTRVSARVTTRVSTGVSRVIHGIDVVAMLHTTHILLARVGFVSELAAVVTRGQLLVQLILAQLRQGWQLEAGVHVLAGRALRTEAR